MVNNKKLLLVFPIIAAVLAAAMLISCRSVPEPIAIHDVNEDVNENETEEVADVFDPVTISEEQYLFVMDEVRLFIEELNEVIRNRNFNAWRGFLSPQYYEYISSPGFLNDLSERPVMRMQRIVLRTSRDFFNHVVVPSRANSRLDDIEFVDEDRIKAFSISIRGGEERREILYHLERINGMWKIIN